MQNLNQSPPLVYVTAIRQVQAEIYKPRGAGNEVEWPNTKKSV